MNKFTKIVEDIEQLKKYKADVKISIVVSARNEAEAGDLIDRKFPTIEGQTHYEITHIEPCSEGIVEDVNPTKDLTAEEIIVGEWNNKKPNEDSFEFYHRMREEGYDGNTILGVIMPLVNGGNEINNQN